MKMLILCENCQAYTEYVVDNYGNTYSSTSENFVLTPTWEIENISDLESMNHIDESNVKVININVNFSCKICRDDQMSLSLE